MGRVGKQNSALPSDIVDKTAGNPDPCSNLAVATPKNEKPNKRFIRFILLLTVYGTLSGQLDYPGDGEFALEA